ncbi:purine/pyrimidine permease [Salinispira pacifica]
MESTLVLALQWVVFHAGVVISAAVILAQGLQLSPEQTGQLMQLTLLLTGAGSLLQFYIGHGRMLIEGPPVPWWAAYLAVVSVALPAGIALTAVRTNIEGAMIVAGGVVVGAGVGGVIRKLRFLFSPRATGVLLTLVAIQASGVALRGLAQHGTAQLILGVAVVIAATLLLSRARGVLRNSAILLSAAAGWIVLATLGLAPFNFAPAPPVSVPSPFPWGRPTFEFGSIFTLTVLGILLIPNVVGSLKAMDQVTGVATRPHRFDRGLATTGLACVAAGALGGIGTAPLAISAGLISVTREKTSRGFLIGAALFVVLGLVPALGQFLSSIPVSVASAVLLISVSSLAVIGLQSATSEPMDANRSSIVGLGLLTGAGVMFMPASVWTELPGWLSGVLSNGVITGTLVAILLEQTVLRKERVSGAERAEPQDIRAR